MFENSLAKTSIWDFDNIYLARLLKQFQAEKKIDV